MIMRELIYDIIMGVSEHMLNGYELLGNAYWVLYMFGMLSVLTLIVIFDDHQNAKKKSKKTKKR